MDKIDQALITALNFHVLPKVYNNKIKTNTEDSEIKEINEAINILKGIAQKYNVKEYIDKEAEKEKYRKNYEETLSGLSENLKIMYAKLNPLVEKQKIAKGKLTEQAVIDYFKSNDYNAEKGGSELDNLKIDVVAKNEHNKIFAQVKSGQVSAKEIVNLVKSVSNLDNNYDEENLKRIACVSADKFPSHSDILRMRLEDEFGIRIMFIHKYQVLMVCPEYKSTVQ